MADQNGINTESPLVGVLEDPKESDEVDYQNNINREAITGFERVPVVRGFTEIENVWLVVKLLGGYICGGYVRYMCSPRRKPEPASDVDIYTVDDKILNALAQYFKDNAGLTVRHENEISITFSQPNLDNTRFAHSPPIQLIKPMREGRVVTNGSVEEIIDNFDFTIIRIALLDERTALADANFLHDEGNRILRLRNIHCPISSTLRCCKYAGKGYWLPPLQAWKLFKDWDGRDDEYREKLADFLQKSAEGEGLTQEQVNELEAMMRID